MYDCIANFVWMWASVLIAISWTENCEAATITQCGIMSLNVIQCLPLRNLIADVWGIISSSVIWCLALHIALNFKIFCLFPAGNFPLRCALSPLEMDLTRCSNTLVKSDGDAWLLADGVAAKKNCSGYREFELHSAKVKRRTVTITWASAVRARQWVHATFLVAP